MRYPLTLAGALLLAILAVPVSAEEPAASAGTPTFGQVDHNHDSTLSLKEMRDVGMDDLAFRAMDLNGDGNISREEYARYRALQRQVNPARPQH
jgi:hypothetical protein